MAIGMNYARVKGPGEGIGRIEVSYDEEFLEKGLWVDFSK